MHAPARPSGDPLAEASRRNSQTPHRGLKQVRGLSAETRKLASELRDNEHQHVDTLTATIKSAGATPVRAPGVDFGKAFSSKSSFLKLAQTLEDDEALQKDEFLQAVQPFVKGAA